MEWALLIIIAELWYHFHFLSAWIGRVWLLRLFSVATLLQFGSLTHVSVFERLIPALVLFWRRRLKRRGFVPFVLWRRTGFPFDHFRSFQHTILLMRIAIITFRLWLIVVACNWDFELLFFWFGIVTALVLLSFCLGLFRWRCGS